MFSVSQIPEQLLGIHPGTATRIHTSSTRCAAMAVERPARRAGSQRGKSIVPLIVQCSRFSAHSAVLGVRLANDGLHLTSTSKEPP